MKNLVFFALPFMSVLNKYHFYFKVFSQLDGLEDLLKFETLC